MVDPTSILKDWGLTLGLLALVACIASLLLMFSLREFSYWFFRVNKVIINQEKILARLEDIEKQFLSQENSDESAAPLKNVEKAEFQLLN
jgi:hypothetical protein